MFYAVYKGVFPVAERDFIAFRTNKKLANGTWVTYGHSILHPSQPIQSSPVRAKGKMGMYCEPVPGMLFPSGFFFVNNISPYNLKENHFCACAENLY